MKTIKPTNSQILEVYLDLGDNAVQLHWYAQVLSVDVDPEDRLVLSVAHDPGQARQEARHFYVMPAAVSIPHRAGVVTHVGAVRRFGRSALHIFEIDSPEERRRRSSFAGESAVNIHSGPVASGSRVTQVGGNIYGGVHAAQGV